MSICSKIGSRYFTWNRASKTFVTEISTLNGNGLNPLSQVWNDSCDAGFVMVSQITGVEVTFVLVDQHRDRDSDITHWEFAASHSDVLRMPALCDVTVIVYNT